MSVSMGRVVAGAAYVLIRAKDETGKVLKEVNAKMVGLNKNLIAMGGGMQRMGLQIGAMGTAMGTSMYTGIREAQKFQDAMLAVQAILNITSEEIKPLTKKVRDLGSSTSYTSEEVALAAEELARGGFSLKQVYESLDDVINLARSGQVTMSEASMYMVRSMMAFNIQATEAARVADALFVASSAGTTTVQELGSALSFSAGTAADLGMSLEEAVATLAIFSNNMLTGTKGGTSLNNLLVEMTRKADKVRDLLGFEMFEAGEARPMIAVFKDLRKALKDMTQEERVPLLMNLFNIRGSRAAQALKQMDLVEEVLKKLETGEITAAEAAKLMDSGIGGSIRRITAALNNLAITFGLSFEGMFQTLEDKAIPIIKGLGAWFEKNADLAKKLAIAFLGIMAAAGGLLVLGTVVKILGFMFFAISSIATALTIVIPLMLKTAVVVGTLLEGFHLMTLLPGDIGKAFAGLEDALYGTFGYIMEIFGKAFTAIKDRIMAGDINGAMNILMVSLNQAFNIGIIQLKKGWLEFTYYIKKIWYEVTAGIKKMWLDVTSWMAKGILDLAAENKFFGAVFKSISGVDVAAERERARRLGNQANMDTAQIDKMNAEETGKLASEHDKSMEDLEKETAKLREQYAADTANAMQAVDQAIEMSKLPDKLVEDAPALDPYKWEQTVGGPEAIKSMVAKSMPEGLEMGSMEAAKAAFDNRKATLDAAQKTARATQETADGIKMMIKKGGVFVFEGVGSSITTPPGG